MGRNLDSSMSAALAAGVVMPVFLVVLTFRSGVRYVWSGVGPLVYGGQTYLGMGSLGSIGGISEGAEVKADGTTVGLSGIDPADLSEALTDVRLGAPARILFGLWDAAAGAMIGAPYQVFRGTVDQPKTSQSGEAATISLALESRMVDLARPSNRRYTAADQHIFYPNDSAFNRVEALNDQSLRWGN